MKVLKEDSEKWGKKAKPILQRNFWVHPSCNVRIGGGKFHLLVKEFEVVARPVPCLFKSSLTQF